MAVREWFAGQEILLTGVTSDIGNAVLEKLLRSSLGIKTIHVVLRSRNCLQKEERIKRILASVGFERVRQERPEPISQLNIIEENLSYDNLGIRKDQLLALKNVSVVIHAGGPQKALLELCSELPVLRAAAVVVSISKESGKITESIEEGHLPSIPLALVKVPAIGPALKEPKPGYLSVLKGATALMVGAGYALGNANFPAAILPVDLAANTLLASAWSKGTRLLEEHNNIRSMLHSIEPVLSKTWLSDQNNVYKLHYQMTPEDQKKFFVCTHVDHKSYTLHSAESIKELFGNDDNVEIIRYFKLFFIISFTMLLVFAMLF